MKLAWFMHQGDVILTGTPEGSGPTETGDMVTAEPKGTITAHPMWEEEI
ncbi:MAG: hypothetical protein HFI66_00725 [Lachnospiraceae bacterium]|jgi:2-keto-4-pentenoate hydratase/2-oxohepta-3-ene-1,7-dioic acid hydratase in catechol pathway|nr:hypothetical protein [Lachnospiraceae bacterium]